MTLTQVISYLEKQDNEAARGPLHELRWCINQGYAHRIDFGNIVFYDLDDPEDTIEFFVGNLLEEIEKEDA